MYLIPSVHFLVEDEDGEVEELNIQSYMPNCHIDPADLFPKNTVIAIKEPFLKISSKKDKEHFIQVCSPTHLVVLDDHCVEKWKTPILLSYDELNDNGNRFYVAKKYEEAIREYTKALKVGFLT